MPPPDSRDETRQAARQVEAEFEELGDPEAAPALPATTLAAHAATRPSPKPVGLKRATTREILRLAWPIIVSQGIVNLAGLIDRAMVGRVGGAESAAVPLAAVGFATQFFFLIQSTLFAVSLACVALMARAIGGGNSERARHSFIASLEVSLVLTILLSGVTLLGDRWLLGLLGAEPQVIEAALPYLRFVIGSSVILSVSMVIDSGLRANRDTKTPMYVAFAVTGVKLFGNWVFIFGNLGAPRLELVGAGLATAFSQAFGLALFLFVVFRAPSDSPVSLKLEHLRGARKLRGEVIRIAMPGVAERLVMNLAMLSYFWVLSFYGTVAVAAYTVGVALLSFSWIPGTGYATACATLVGQSLGAEERDEAKRTGWLSAALAVGTAIPLGLLCAVGREPLARLFTDDQQVISELGPFMLALALAQPFLQLHFTLAGAHRGAGDTWTPLVAASVGNWLFRVPLALLCAVVLHTDVVWVWVVLIFDHVARSGVLLFSFQRGKWLDTQVDSS
jgi:putative MATE family efflux protein